MALFKEKFTTGKNGHVYHVSSKKEEKHPITGKPMSHYLGTTEERIAKRAANGINSKHKALETRTKGHKHNERETRAKKLGYYPHGHKNYGDVYEA